MPEWGLAFTGVAYLPLIGVVMALKAGREELADSGKTASFSGFLDQVEDTK